MAIACMGVVVVMYAQIEYDVLSQDSIIGIKDTTSSAMNDLMVEKKTTLISAPETNLVQLTSDTIIDAEDKKLLTVSVSTKSFKPSPKKAVLYSAIFPGLGQIYNRKYWKLPIVYGGFMGCAYAIIWNNQYYNTYKQGFLDIMDDDETTDSWKDVLSYWQKKDITPEKEKWLKEVFKKRKDYYRYYRDLSIIVAVGLYALCMIDAYVDAQLYDFDISPDLSMRVEPVVFQRNYFASNAIGLQCRFSF